LVDQNTLPWLGCNKDFVGSFGLFAVPRKLGHHAKEAASAFWGLDLAQLLEDFPIRSHFLEGREGNMAEAVVPSHQLGLIISGSKRGVVVGCSWRRGVEGKSPLPGCMLGELESI
jgi:hypothetical protein